VEFKIMGLRTLTHKCQISKTVPSTDLCFKPAGYEMILMEISGFRKISKAQDHNSSSLALRERTKSLCRRSAAPQTECFSPDLERKSL